MDEPRSFLRSQAVLEQVILDLNLQAAIVGNPTPGRIREAWYTLKAACLRQHLKRKQPASPILTHDVEAPDRLFVPDLEFPVLCSQVHFFSETSQRLMIRCKEGSSYLVYADGKPIGQGEIGLPFLWEKGSFLLTGSLARGKTYFLDFVPLEQAVLSLQKSLHILRDKENSSLLRISYTHRDRHLAAKIVNAVMEQFENYLRNEGKKKITKQLDYLQQRQSETHALLEEVLEKHKHYLETHLDSGAILSLERELQFMTDRQSEIQQQILDIQTEMDYLSPNKMSFPLLVERLRQERKREPLHTLSVEGARSLIQSRQQELDLIRYNQERYNNYLDKLREEQFDTSSLFDLLNNEICRPRFQKIESLHHALVDSKNWSAKEREQIKGELETEKQFIISHLQHLREGCSLHEKAVTERISFLQKNLLYLLLDRYEQEKNALIALAEQATHFPQKWLNQQKIELNTQLYTQMIISITQIIEAKNIGYNLDYLMASCFKKAPSPVAPNPPKLFLKTVLGICVGAFLIVIAISFYVIWLGPSASPIHLHHLGYKLIPEKETVPRLGLELEHCGPLILISSPSSVPFLPSMLKWLSHKGEKVHLIDLSSRLPPRFMRGKERESYLASSSFQTLLAGYKREYDRIFLLSHQPINSFEFAALSRHADALIYGITTERLEQIRSLPEKTFFFKAECKAPSLLSLREIKPLLDQTMTNLKNSSFSSQKMWNHFPLKKP